MTDQNSVPSPCIGVCSIDDQSGLCQGCFRTVEEIQQWWDMDNATKTEVIKQASIREASIFGD